MSDGPTLTYFIRMGGWLIKADSGGGGGVGGGRERETTSDGELWEITRL